MFGSPSKAREKIIAIADIRSDSAGVCIARFNRNEVAEIIAAERRTLPFEDRTQDRARDGVLSLLHDACENTLAAYAKAGTGVRVQPVEQSYLVIGSPWVSSLTMPASQQFDTETRIDDEIIGNLARQAFRSQTQYDRADIFEAGIAIVELNGYPTEKPVGRYAQTVFVSALLSECDTTLRSGATEIMKSTFPAAEPVLRSESRALISISLDELERPRDRTIMSIDGDTTNCVIVRKGTMAEHVTIPEGTRTLLKRIAGQGLPEETLSLMRMMAKDTCTTAACESLQKSLALLEPDLAKAFGQPLAEISARHRLSNSLVLVARPELASWLAQFFTRIDFAPFTITSQPFVPEVMTAEHMSKYAYAAPGVSIDTGLALAASLVNIEDFRG